MSVKLLYVFFIPVYALGLYFLLFSRQIALTTAYCYSTNYSTTGKASADAPKRSAGGYSLPTPDRTRTNKTEKKSMSDKALAAVISCVGRQPLAVIPTALEAI